VATIRKHTGAIRITDEALEIYRWARSIKEDGDHEEWEPQGRRGEFLNLDVALSNMLGLELWDSAVFDVSASRDPKTRPLIEALEKAAEAEEAAGRPLIRPNGNGLVESEEALKRTTEALTRSRVG
jgi:hypothetical protein